MTLKQAMEQEDIDPDSMAYLARVHVSHIIGILKGTQQPSNLIKERIERYFPDGMIEW